MSCLDNFESRLSFAGFGADVHCWEFRLNGSAQSSENVGPQLGRELEIQIES